MDSVGLALTIALQTFATANGSVTSPSWSHGEQSLGEVETADARVHETSSSQKNHELTVTWSPIRATLSVDGGRTLQSVVDAPPGLTLRHAAISAEGALYVVLDGPRGDSVPVGTAAQLVTVSLDGTQRMLELPPGEVDELVVGPRNSLAVVLHRPAEAFPEVVSTSLDGGESWTAPEVRGGEAGFELVWSADGGWPRVP